VFAFVLILCGRYAGARSSDIVQRGARVALLSRGTDLIYGDFVFEGIFPTSEVASGCLWQEILTPNM
jgi:hypothetical protein